jgi:hypothetical protein
VTVSVEKDAGAVTSTFTADDGLLLAVEHLEEAEPEVDGDTDAASAGPVAFRTGPIDGSRVRALLWSIGCLRGEPDWKWGGEPPALVERVVALLLPSIVAGRAATGPARWARRVERVTCQPTGTAIPDGDILEVAGAGAGDFRLAAHGVGVAHAFVTLTEATAPGR